LRGGTPIFRRVDPSRKFGGGLRVTIDRDPRMANSARMAVPPHDEGKRSGAPMTDPVRWKRIKEVLQKALEQEPHKRDLFVREICDGDSALCAEVESLLSAHQDAGSFIESPPFAALTESAEAVRHACDRQGALKAGDRVGT